MESTRPDETLSRQAGNSADRGLELTFDQALSGLVRLSATETADAARDSEAFEDAEAAATISICTHR
jgi:hypothetical protein